MSWTTPTFEEIKMDAEARGYGGWLTEEAPVEEQGPEVAADAASE